MSQALQEIIRFQTDRGLDKHEYYPQNEHANIVEELLESVGYDVPKEQHAQLGREWMKFTMFLEAKNVIKIGDGDGNVDAYCDIIVFTVGALLKLGYDPELALLECAKEINSREGLMVNGKFEKDLSDEAKAKWYKANYVECKIKGA